MNSPRALSILALLFTILLAVSACEEGPTELDELPLSELGGQCRTDADCVAGLHCCDDMCQECCKDEDCEEGEECVFATYAHVATTGRTANECMRLFPDSPQSEESLPEEEQVVPHILGESEEEWFQWFEDEWNEAWEVGCWDCIADLWDWWIQTFYPEEWAEHCARALMANPPTIKVLHWTGPETVIYVIEGLAIPIDNVFAVYVDVTTVQNQTTSQVIYVTPKEDGSPAIFPNCDCGLGSTPTEPASTCITDQDCEDWYCCPDGICHECCVDEHCDPDDYCDYQYECWSREAAGVPCGDVVCRQGERCVDGECAECAIDGDCDPEGMCFDDTCITPGCIGDPDCEPGLWCSGCTCGEIIPCETAADCGEAEACVQYRGLLEDTEHQICVPVEETQPPPAPDSEVTQGLAEFQVRYHAAFESGDPVALWTVIHPLANTVFPDCPGYAESVIGTPVTIEIVDWTGPFTWAWRPAGNLLILIPEVIRVNANFTALNQTTQQQFHVAKGPDGSYNFFTICGDAMALDESVLSPAEALYWGAGDGCADGYCLQVCPCSVCVDDEDCEDADVDCSDDECVGDFSCVGEECVPYELVKDQQPPSTTGTTVNVSLPEDMGGRVVLFDNAMVYLMSGSLENLPAWYGLDPSVAVPNICQVREEIASASLQGRNASFSNLNLPPGRYFVWAGYRVCRGGLVRELLVAEFEVTDGGQVNVVLGWF